MDRSPHKSGFVNVNGIRLHYLDWGGSGPVLLFLAGMGCNAHIFDHFAPRFIGKFHVLGLTRLGHGESDHPESGYTVDTFVEDIRKFMDALHIEKAVLAGHSLAGIELSHMGALYPERVLSLIYLDAAYDRSNESYKNFIAKNPIPKMKAPGQKEAYYNFSEYFASVRIAYPGLDAVWGEVIEEQGRHELTIAADGKIIDKMTDAIGEAVSTAMKTYVPEDASIKLPTLGIFALGNCRYYIADWMSEEQKAQVRDFFAKVNDPWQEENIARFRANMPHAKVVIIPEGHHYCFLKKEDEVYEAMMEFLSDPVNR
jgi:pimeloyl-ACP methyl ester carboxylesterase